MFKRFVLVLLVVLAAVPAAYAATAEFLPEQEQLNARDNKLAKKVTLRGTDLGRGWKSFNFGDSSVDNESLHSCPGFDLDVSSYTITGRAGSAFRNPFGSTVAANVEVFASEDQAAADFTAFATHPLMLQCTRTVFEQSLLEEAEPGITVELSSGEQITAPRVGQQMYAYRILMNVTYQGQMIEVYLDGLAFQKGRTVASLVFINAIKPYAARPAVARKLAARVR